MSVEWKIANNISAKGLTVDFLYLNGFIRNEFTINVSVCSTFILPYLIVTHHRSHINYHAFFYVRLELQNNVLLPTNASRWHAVAPSFFPRTFSGENEREKKKPRQKTRMGTVAWKEVTAHKKEIRSPNGKWIRWNTLDFIVTFARSIIRSQTRSASVYGKI